jgi:hypothetical protein
VESNIVKISYYGIVAVLLVVIAMTLAGCTASKTVGTGSDSSGSTGAASSSSAAAATTAATCPTLSSGTGIWSGTWNTIASTSKCSDERGKFNPPVNGVDQWQTSNAGEFAMNPVSITQKGCDVTGTVTVSGYPVSTPSCPITFTGTASGTGVTGTWKSYCIVGFGTDVNKQVEQGIFDLYMNPDNSGFAGTFTCDTPVCRQSIADNCPNANGNWVGKRIS